MKKTPVYGLHDFDRQHHEAGLYVNDFGTHVKEHAFTHLPHKHDFYLVVLVTQGSGHHEIDFKEYEVKPGSVFFMKPGQMHYWKFSPGVKGFVFFHSRSFFEEDYLHHRLQELPFFKSLQKHCCIYLNPKEVKQLLPFFHELQKEHTSSGKYKLQKLQTLVSLIYIELARLYVSTEGENSNKYLQIFYRFDELLEQHFIQNKLPNFYARRLHITEKHLNRVVRECIDSTSTNYIAERVTLEAKRLLIHSGLNVAETGYRLGFEDTSYFIRFFKKHCGLTPLAFLKQYH